MEFITAYGPKNRVRFDQSIMDPITGELQTSRTKQSFAQESEINNIMAKYEKTGVIDHVKEHGGYAEMPAGLEYQDALQLTIDAQLAFDGLPAKTRKEFGNDAFQFLAFVEDPENVERMAELGLIGLPDDEVSAEGDPALEAAVEPAPGAGDPPA